MRIKNVKLLWGGGMQGGTLMSPNIFVGTLEQIPTCKHQIFDYYVKITATAGKKGLEIWNLRKGFQPALPTGLSINWIQ